MSAASWGWMGTSPLLGSSGWSSSEWSSWAAAPSSSEAVRECLVGGEPPSVSALEVRLRFLDGALRGESGGWLGFESGSWWADERVARAMGSESESED